MRWHSTLLVAAIISVHLGSSCSSLAADPKPAEKDAAHALTNSIGMKLVLIPAGEFMMGNSHTVEEEVAVFDRYDMRLEPGFFRREYPRHRVRIAAPFYLGAHEVTRGQFRRFVETTNYRTDAEKSDTGAFGIDSSGELIDKPDYSWRNASFPQSDEHPVVNVSWNDAVAFCAWLRRKESKAYRLPTPAQWEYACRAGTTTRYHSGDDPETLAQVANVGDASFAKKFPSSRTIAASDGYVFTAPVGKFRANSFGLYDMHGNVMEWCADWYDSSYRGSPMADSATPASQNRLRAARGGGWHSSAYGCRSATRDGIAAKFCACDLGFRVAIVPAD